MGHGGGGKRERGGGGGHVRALRTQSLRTQSLRTCMEFIHVNICGTFSSFFL